MASCGAAGDKCLAGSELQGDVCFGHFSPVKWESSSHAVLSRKPA